MSGVDLRLTVLAVPPVIPLIHRDLGVDEKTIGLVTGLTPALLALAAIPGSLLIARIGARRALIAGLLLMAVTSALRGLGPSVAVLVVMTFAMAAAIAVIQPAFPTLVHLWFPDRVGFATALYSNGLLMGEIIPAALTVPLAALLGGHWELALVAWSIPVAATALVVALTTPHIERDPGEPRARWWPDWRDPETWYLGFIFGGASALYWTANAFLPDYFHITGRTGLVGAGLTALNGGQIPASLLLAIFAGRVVGKRWPFVVLGAAAVVALVGFFTMPGAWGVLWAGVFGFTAAGNLVLTLAMPPLLTGAADVHRLSAGIFTITYTCSFLSPLIGGAAWDLTHQPLLAFAPATLASVLIVVFALLLRLPGHQREAVAA